MIESNLTPSDRAGEAALPRRSPWLLWGFQRYVRRYVARRVHAVRVLRGRYDPASVAADQPVVVVMNHPSWWDPMAVAVAGPHFFPDRAHFAPIDQTMLQRYAVFERLGFFGVDQGTPRGATQFLRTAGAITRAPATALWITAQGTFRDVRARPTELRRGAGHLAARMQRGVILPMAVELTYWQQRTPEVLLAFGRGFQVGASGGDDRRDAAKWTAWMRDGLEDTMDRLAEAAIARDPAAFDTILAGRAGAGGVYDMARRLESWLRGRRFVADHPVTNGES